MGEARAQVRPRPGIPRHVNFVAHALLRVQRVLPTGYAPRNARSEIGP